MVESGAKDAESTVRSSSNWLAGLRVVSLLTFLSRILGLVRDILMAAVFGNSAVMDAFSVAFRVPNLARRLFGEGAVSTAFLPIFIQHWDERGEESAWRLAATMIAGLAGLLLSIVLLGELLLWAAYARWGDTANSQLLIFLTAVMLPYLVLICLAAQFSAVLHARDHFTRPALLPVILNVVWIGTLVVIVPRYESPFEKVTAVAVGVLVGGVLQLAAPWPALTRLGFRFRPDWASHRNDVGRIARTILPILLGLSITQINSIADSLIAWAFAQPADGPETMAAFGDVSYPLREGTASAIYFAQRMYQFPLGVFGIALGTVLFPLFAKQSQAGERDKLRESLAMGLRLMLAIGIPASIGLVILADPITRLFFQYGEFDASAAGQTAGMIAVYSSAVWAYCGLLIVQRGFFALGDRTTPVRMGKLAVALNLGLNFALLWPLGGNGLALATAVTAMLQFVVTTILLQSHVGRFDWHSFGVTLAKTILAGGLMAAVCVGVMSSLGAGDTFAARVVQVVGPLLAGVVTFAFAARVLGLQEPWLIFRRRKE